MKRIFFFLLLTLVFIVLTSCQKETRSYLNFYVWGDAMEISWYERIASDFKKETGIEVKVVPATGDYYDNLNILLGSKKNAPDIFFTEQGEILSQLAANRLLNLSPYIETKVLDVQTETNPNGKIKLWHINDVYKFDGNYYAFIKDWSPDFILWYNKDHIDEYNRTHGYQKGDPEYMEYPSETVPLTWDEFLDMSYKLTIKNNQTVRYGTMLDRVPWKHLFEWIQMTGDTPFIDNKYFNANSEGVKQAFRFFANLQVGPQSSAPIVGPTGRGSGEMFANGDVSFVWFGSWAYSAFNFDNVSFNIGIAPPPVPSKNEPLTEVDRYGVTAGMIALAINKDTPLKDEAVKFLNFYMIKGLEYMATKGFNIPGNQLIAESDIYRNPEDAFLRYMNNFFLDFALNYTEPIRYNNYLSQKKIEDIIAKHISTWFNNYNEGDLDKVLNNIANDINNEIE